jgi:hypothetical protein
LVKWKFSLLRDKLVVVQNKFHTNREFWCMVALENYFYIGLCVHICWNHQNPYILDFTLIKGIIIVKFF